MTHTIDDLRERLRSSSDSVRVEAVKALACSGGNEAIALLEMLLDDDNVAVRYYARRSLRELRETRIPEGSTVANAGVEARERIAVQPPEEHGAQKLRQPSQDRPQDDVALAGLMSAPTALAPAQQPTAVVEGDAERKAAVKTPSKRGRTTKKVVAPAATSPPPSPELPLNDLPRLLNAASAVLRPSAELLVELLDVPDDEVVAAAAQALGRMKVVSARRRLLDILRSGPLSHEVIMAVADIEAEEAVELLIRLYNHERGAPFRHSIVKALWFLPGDTAEDFVRRAFASPDPSIQTTLVRVAGEDEGGSRYVDRLLDCLGTADEYFQSAVLSALSRHASRDARIPARLTEMLAINRNPRQVSAMICSIAASGDPAYVSALQPFLEDGDRRVRANAVEALGCFGLPAASLADCLHPLLGDGDNRVRANAALVLARLAVPEAIRMLQDMVGHPSKWFRASACYALGKLGSLAAIPFIGRALQDPDSDVRLNAVRALRNLADETAIQHLVLATNDRNLWVRLHAVEGLGRTAHAEAHAPLRRLLPTESNVQVLAAALVSLGRTGAEDPVGTAKFLAEFLKSDNERVRLAALEGLELIMSPDLLPLVVPCLRDMDGAVRARAVLIIWKFGEVKIVASLYGMLKQGGREARLSAMHILSNLGDFHRRLREEDRVEYFVAALRQHPVYEKG